LQNIIISTLLQHHISITGDLVKIHMKVKTEESGKIFQLYTGHYHKKKESLDCSNINHPKCPWYQSDNDANVISRHYLTPGEWTTIEAVHRIAGDEWKDHTGAELYPKNCNHYQLRMRVAGGQNTPYWIDDMRVQRIQPATESLVPHDSVTSSGFIMNNIFEYSMSWWKIGDIMLAPIIEKDEDIQRDVMVIRGPNFIRDKIVLQNVMGYEIPQANYQYRFWLKLLDVSRPINFHILLRMRFHNNDLVNGPCDKEECVFDRRPFNQPVSSNGGIWQEFKTDVFDMFADEELGQYQYWDGYVKSLHWSLYSTDMEPLGTWKTAGFEALSVTVSYLLCISVYFHFGNSTFILYCSL